MSGGSLPLVAVGLSFGFALGLLLLARAWIERNGLAAALASLILIGAAAGSLIALSWAAPKGPRDVTDLAEMTELALTLAVGPSVLFVLAALLRAPLDRIWTGGPAVAAFVALVVLERRYGGDPVVYAVPIAAAYTLMGWLLFARTRTAERPLGRRARRPRRLALAVLAAVSIANSASIARLAFPDFEALRPIVPWTLSLLFIAVLTSIVWAFLQRHSEILAQPPDSGSDGARLVSSASALVVRERLFRDQQLKPADVASRLGVSAASLAAALAAGDHDGFPAFLQSIRLDQARLMLSDPAERATSIEAVGLLCGFRSRSAFYEAFQRRFGTTPGAYRAKSLSGR